MTVLDFVVALLIDAVVIFVPGYLWMRVLAKGLALEVWETIALSFVIGLVLVAAAVFFASFAFRVPLNQATLVAILVATSGSAIAVLYARRDPWLLRVLGPLARRPPSC